MAVTCNSNDIAFEWQVHDIFWTNQAYKSKEFYLLEGKHKFYFEIKRNQLLGNYDLFIVNPEKIKVNLNVYMSYEINSTKFTFNKKNFKINLERCYLMKLLGRPSKIIFVCTITQEPKTAGSETHEPKIVSTVKEPAEDLNKVQKRTQSNLKDEKGIALLSDDLKNAFLNEEDSDVILKVGDKTYPAHKVIIRNRSSVFRAMLGHDMTEKNKGVIDIEDCDPIFFRDFLLYLYTGKMDDLSTNNVFDLYYMADKYNVSQLKLSCVNFLWKHLNIDNICYVISLAMKHCERDLLNHAVLFFIKNAEDVFPTVEWQKFLASNPTQANELIIKAFKNKSAK